MIDIGRSKRATTVYGFDDIAIVPTRRTRTPSDVNLTWTIESIPPLEEIRLLYRRLMVRGGGIEEGEAIVCHPLANQCPVCGMDKWNLIRLSLPLTDFPADRLRCR